MEDNDRGTWLSIDAAAAHLDCSRGEIQQRIDAGEIRSVQTIGKTWVKIANPLDQPASTADPGPRPTARSAVLAWSLLLIIVVASAVAGTWIQGRMTNLKNELRARQTHEQTVQEALTFARQEIQEVRRQLAETEKQIQQMDALVEATGKELAQRDVVARDAHTKLLERNERLNAQIIELETQLTQARQPLADKSAADSHAQAPNPDQAADDAP